MASIKTRKLKSGKTVWDFIVDIGRDPLTNKRRQKVGRGYSSEREARKACEKFLSELAQGKKQTSVTLSEFGKSFLEKEVKNLVAFSTYQNQSQWFRDYVEPHIGQKRMDKLTYEDIVNLYDVLLKKGVSRGTIKNVDNIISKIFTSAKSKRIILDNFMRDVTPPTYRPEIKKIWNRDQVARFLEISAGSELHPLYHLAFTTGMRLGELLGLEWDYIDFENCTVTIVKQQKYTSEEGRHVKFPKHENSLRTINIPRTTIDVLAAHRKKQLPGISYCFDNAGERFYNSEINRRFQRDAKSLGMPSITFHGIRHTHATLLLQDGWNVKVVAERLGDTVDTVLRTYAHVLPSMQKQVAESLEKKLFPVAKPVDNSNEVITNVIKLVK